MDKGYRYRRPGRPSSAGRPAPGRENLVYRAAELFFAECGQKTDISITLTKNILAGSGLGSGSSDAAATLIGLNRFLKTNLDKETLTKLAMQLGSDVAFFLNGPLALCKGRGEKIKKIDENFDFSALLILPNVSVSTKKVYDNYRHDQALYEKLSNRINGYLEKNRIDLITGMCANMLDKSCFDVAKSLTELRKKIESSGIRPCCLSGSGSAMFYFIGCANEQKARRYEQKLGGKIGCRSIVVRNNGW